ncbi:MAG TPA: hypothetical protein VFM11_08045 [Burkholderiales bacterium]|nr:hypothetical protein [Burkholderiales bacterium]
MKKLTAGIGALALGTSVLVATPLIALAGTIDSNDTFYKTVSDRTEGAVGAGLAMTMLVTGGTIGVARNSPISTSHGDARQLTEAAAQIVHHDDIAGDAQ